MTAGEVISRADTLAPNQYTSEQKLNWLSDFDGKVFHEVFMTHEPGFGVMYFFEKVEDADGEMLIPEPYAADVYVNYLLAKIAEANAEVPKYNLYSTLFNTEYTQFTNWFNRTHMPTGEKRWRF